jgi:hypothetical protein
MKTNLPSPVRVLPAASAIAMVLLLSACSTTSQPTGPSTAPSAGAGVTSTSAAATYVSPLEAYTNSLTGLSGSYADVQEQTYQLDLKRENLVATCMTKNGFSYTPEAVKNTRTSGQSGPSDSELDTQAWVQKYGYGAVYLPDGLTGALEQAQSQQSNLKQSGASAATPNSRYRSSLTAAEQKAYDAALDGANGSDPTLTVGKDWQKLGCDGAALHTVQNESAIMGSTQGKTVEKAIERFENGYSTWPGIADAEKAWSSCMSGSGYAGYSHQGDPAVQFIKQNTTLWTSVASGAQPPTAELDALAKKERTVALADLKCREKTNYRSTIQAITTRQEKQFLADNRVALDALKATTTQSGSK